MPAFAYTARDSSGAAVSGTLVAASVAEVTQMLRADGKYPVAVRPAGEAAAPRAARGIKISRADVIALATQLSVMVETGVTLSEALDCIVAQTEKPNVKAVVTDLSQQVQAGGDFSSAPASHPRSFPCQFVALIKASEKSGMMGKLLARDTA
jgi:type II secretory pathway component PulF